MDFFALPFVFLKFWYIEAPFGLFRFFASVNISILNFFSFSILLKTFFRPIKNEYRKGLVGFSIGMGMFIKTFLILFAGMTVILLSLLELAFIFLFLGFPAIAFIFLFV